MADPKTKTRFLAYHYPALQSGNYIIEQEIVMPSGMADGKAGIPSIKQYFVVSGERFRLTTDQVFAVFPPKDSQGDYTACLPHIELKRSTLPWERSAIKQHDKSPASYKMPWLALLIISEEEMERKDVIPATVATEAYINQYSLSKDHVMIKDMDEIDILKCTKAYLDKLIAPPEDLKLLSHVRQVIGKDEGGLTHMPDERAIIVCRTMPEAGKSYIVHLVSLEERYDGDQLILKPDAQQMDWLVSLYHWRFTNIEDENYKPDALALSKLRTQAQTNGGLEKLGLTKIQFERIYEVLSKNLSTYGDAPLFRSSGGFKAYMKEEHLYPEEIETLITAPVLECFKWEAGTLRSLLNNLNAGPLQLTLAQPLTDKNAIASYLNLGGVPLPHHLRAGGKTVSWYRGPFTALNTRFEDDCSMMLLTHQHADELIQFNKDTGLLDISYAAAWELGKIMFINEPKLMQQLQLWKQEIIFDEILEKQRNESVHLAGFIAQPQNERLPEPIVSFLLQSFKFINFPFNYLVPDNRLLPAESLRFFKVDETWLKFFLYGVISVGERISIEKITRIHDGIRQELKNQIENIIQAKDYYTNKENAVYGMLINSDAISGWPALEVEAYNTETGKSIQIALLHKEYLSENVMLCLFYGEMNRIVLYLPTGASHFGFDRDKTSGSYSKTLKDGKTQIKPFGNNTINATNLSAQMSATTSGDFAVKLLHKQDMVTFEIMPSKD